MNEQKTIDSIVVFYDNQCIFCLRCMQWMKKQKALIPIEFYPMHDEQTKHKYIHLKKHFVRDQFVVEDSNGGVYVDTDARIMCLYALSRYRDLSYKISEPNARRMADKFFDIISKNRMIISRLFFFRREVDSLMQANTANQQDVQEDS